MSARRNVLAGLLNSVWYAIASFAVVPFYLHYLGAASYGLIGFFLTLQGLLLLLDLGLTPAVSREVAARRQQTSEAKPLADFLHSVALCYWGVALSIFLGLCLFSGAIAHRWLQADALPDGEVATIVILMGVAIACRFPHEIYRGALTLLMRRAAWRVLGSSDSHGRHKPRFDGGQLKTIWHFSAGMTLVSIASITLLQLDMNCGVLN